MSDNSVTKEETRKAVHGVHMALNMVVILALGFATACSTNDDLLLTHPVPAAFPKLADVPPRPARTMTAAQRVALQRELEDLAASHEQTRTRQINRR